MRKFVVVDETSTTTNFLIQTFSISMMKQDCKLGVVSPCWTEILDRNIINPFCGHNPVI